MKSTVIWVLRHLVVPVGFIWAMGIFSLFSRIEKIDTTIAEPYRTFNANDFQTLEMNPKNLVIYSDSLYSIRLGQISSRGIYMPEDYFHDLKQYRMFESLYKDSLDKTPEGQHLILRCLSSFGGTLGKLVNLRDENWRKLDFEKLKIMGVEEARKKWFPAEYAHEQEMVESIKSSGFLSDFCGSIVNWFCFVYLRGFFFAFLMILLWRLRLKEERFNPVSFAVSLVFWPIILLIDIRNRSNLMLKKAEIISRRKNLISLFSRKEHELLRRGAKISRREFRKMLDDMGFVRRHSFGKILLFAIFLEIAVPCSFVVSANNPRFCAKEECVMYFSADRDIGRQKQVTWELCTAVSIPYVAKKVVIFFSQKKIGNILSGFIREILGVPRLELFIPVG